jgi:hypothetical protein
MKNSLTLLIFIMAIISEPCFAQEAEDKIDIIKITVYPPRRPYSQISIEIIKTHTTTRDVWVNVKSVPGIHNEEKWKASKMDTTFIIDKKIFDDLANEVVPILKK